MSSVTPGPVPTKHIFIHEIAKQPAGSKVRFLGCVIGYDVSSGILVLEHVISDDAPQCPRVRVDIKLILESIKSDELQRGAWLNIIGYVSRSASRRNIIPGSESISLQTDRSSVQALVAWTAGAIRIGNYEQILMQQQEVMKQLQAAR